MLTNHIEDDPKWDGTDGAHPAWWRGHEHTVITMCNEIKLLLLSNKSDSGVCTEPWESTRQLIIKLRKENEELCKLRILVQELRREIYDSLRPDIGDL